MNKRDRFTGFTLIEVLVVIAVMSAMSVAIIPSFSSYLRSQALKQAQENVKSDMRSVQNRALTGVLNDHVVGSDTIAYWGIKFETDDTDPSNPVSRYILFPSTSNDSSGCTADDQVPEERYVQTLEGGIYFDVALYSTTLSGCVFFSMANGDAVTVGLDDLDGSNDFYEIRLVRGSAQRDVLVNNYGLIVSN